MLAWCNKLSQIVFVFSAALLSTVANAQQVGPEALLSYQPAHKNDVQVETPKAEEVSKCKVKVEQVGKLSGYVVFGPEGQILRRFMDTTGDGKVDEFKYFQFGLEVYRDLDTNGDSKAEQSRWFNTQGTRWGIDPDQDGTIDSWRMISAEEATREAILALTTRNVQRLKAVMINSDDVKALGLSAPIGKRYLENSHDLAKQMQALLASSKVITPQAKWRRFDSSMLMPNLVPADSGKAANDLLVYENVMAIVSIGGENGFVQIGEMVRVGASWKLTQVPKPIEGNQFEVGDGGLLLQPNIAGMASSTSEELSPEMRALLDQLRDLDAKSPGATSTNEEIAKFNVARARLLAQIGNLAENPADKKLWFRQRLEMIAAATQMGTFPNGLKELQSIIATLRKNEGNQEHLAFAVLQEMLVRYNLSLQTAKAEDRADVQAAWLDSLEAFVKEFPKAPESADALLQLAITNECNGSVKEARIWYTKLVNDYSGTNAARHGQGALRRLGLTGQQIALAGKSLVGGRPLSLASYRGKVTAVIFWATWCKPCTEDLPQIQKLYKTYQRDGFEVVGVNLDSPGADIAGYIKNFRVSWPHIHEEGGLESRPATEYGIISLPTMFLVDRSGRVVKNGATVDDLKKLVPELLKK